VAEAEFLLWHRPAAVVAFQLLQQTGDSLYKSKTTRPVFCIMVKQGHQQLSRLLEGVNRISSCCMAPHSKFYGLLSWGH